jgi:DNA-binding CsgD family transcriptional regulator
VTPLAVVVVEDRRLTEERGRAMSQVTEQPEVAGGPHHRAAEIGQEPHRPVGMPEVPHRAVGTPEVPHRAAGTVAWIDLYTGSGDGPDAGTRAIAYARRQVRRAVRGDDRVCPVGNASVAVQFGPVASVIPLDVLGERLARAIAPGPPFARDDAGLVVAVGMAAPGLDGTADQVTRRARSAARTSSRALGPGLHPRHTTTAVTVDDQVAALPGRVADGATPVGVGRRAVHRTSVGRTTGSSTLMASGRRAGTRTAGEPPPASSQCVLVVDPMAAGRRTTGYLARAAAAVAEGLGCRAAVTTVTPDEPLPMTVDGADVDLVVVVVDPASTSGWAHWADGPWGLPSRLTAAYVDKGTPVLAVGAGAGALASCVAQGALALFSLERLDDALRSLDGLALEEVRQVAELEYPSRFRSLLGLTAGERRVLFHLTEGWAAQDIADELVVSLTTVRSHIRSILRKLEVRSQLAAVAVANSRDLEQHQVTPSA